MNRVPGFVIRGGWGAFLLVKPDVGLSLLEGEDRTSEPAHIVMRILGARHLLELGLEMRHGARWRRAGGVIDAIHSVTALSFGAIDDTWRRAAFADAAVAAGFSAAGLSAKVKKKAKANT